MRLKKLLSAALTVVELHSTVGVLAVCVLYSNTLADLNGCMKHYYFGQQLLHHLQCDL